MSSIIVGLALVLVVWVILVVFAGFARLWLAEKDRHELLAEDRVVSWKDVEAASPSGIVLINNSKKQWHGLRVWWIPTDQTNVDELDVLRLWFSSGKLIHERNLDETRIRASHHRVIVYDD